MFKVSILSMECLPIDREEPCVCSSSYAFFSPISNDLVLLIGFLSSLIFPFDFILCSSQGNLAIGT